MLTVPFFLFLPSVNTIVGIGDAYVMAIAMTSGPAPCIVATVCHTLAASMFVPNDQRSILHRIVFNLSSTVCGAWIYSNVYVLLNPDRSFQAPAVILPVVALTITFFLFNSFSIATAISLSSGQNILRFWIQNYLPLGVEFSISAVSAGLIVTLHQFNRWVPLAVAPLIGVVWGWNKTKPSQSY